MTAALVLTLGAATVDSFSPNPMLILGHLGDAHPFRQLLRDARELSGRSYHLIDRVDTTVLAEFNTSLLSCCIVVDEGDVESSMLLVKSAVADSPQTPVLLLTSRHTAALESQAIAAGADDCVGTSELTAAALTRIVARTLQRADRRRRLLYAMPIPLVHATLQGTVHWANSAFLALFSCADLDEVRLLGLESLIVTFAHRLNRAGAPDPFSSQQIIAQRSGGHRDVVMMISCLNRLAPEDRLLAR